MTKTITLPCTAATLENLLHSVCDNHGCWHTAKVTAEGDQLTLTFETDKQLEQKETQNVN